MTRRRPLQSRGPEPAWGELPSVWCSRRAARANFPLLLPSSSLPPPPVFSAPSGPSPCMSDFPPEGGCHIRGQHMTESLYGLFLQMHCQNRRVTCMHGASSFNVSRSGCKGSSS